MTMQATGQAPAFDDVQEFTPIFDDGTYILTVARIEATEGQFGAGLKWVFTMVNKATGEPVYAPNSSELYEFFQYSSTKVTPRTKVYPWLVAFLGRPLQIGESGAALVSAVLGRSAEAMIGVEAGDMGGRQKILTIKAVGGKTARTAAQVTPPAAPKYTAQGDLMEPDEDDEDALLARLEAARARKGAANRAKAGVSDETYNAIFKDELPL